MTTTENIFYTIFQSLLGKFVGGLTALVGIFTITLPIPIVVNSFAGFYKNRLWRNEVAENKSEKLKTIKSKMDNNDGSINNIINA